MGWKDGDKFDVNHAVVYVVFVVLGNKPRPIIPDCFNGGIVCALYDLGVFAFNKASKPHAILVICSSARNADVKGFV